MKTKMLEFDNELDRIKNEIAYMQADERKSKVTELWLPFYYDYEYHYYDY